MVNQLQKYFYLKENGSESRIHGTLFDPIKKDKWKLFGTGRPPPQSRFTTQSGNLKCLYQPLVQDHIIEHITDNPVMVNLNKNF